MGASLTYGGIVSKGACDCGKNLAGITYGAGGDIAAGGAGGGGSVSGSRCSLGGAGGFGRMGVGAGFSAGGEICYTSVTCLNTPKGCDCPNQ